jgi:hypothetical protein
LTFCFAEASAGNNMLASIAMMLMTTSSSMSVKPRRNRQLIEELFIAVLFFPERVWLREAGPELVSGVLRFLRLFVPGLSGANW